MSADAVGGADALTDMLKVAADKAAESNMTKDDIIDQTQALRAIPPHHPEASKPHDAYRRVLCPLLFIIFFIIVKHFTSDTQPSLAARLGSCDYLWLIESCWDPCDH